MATQNVPRKRRAQPSPHHEPYPDRLHRHLAAAADAYAALAAVPLAEGLDSPGDGSDDRTEAVSGQEGASSE